MWPSQFKGEELSSKSKHLSVSVAAVGAFKAECALLLICSIRINTSRLIQFWFRRRIWSYWDLGKTLLYRGSPDSTKFLLLGNCAIAKIVLSGDWFSTKIVVYDFWISKVLFFSYLMLKKGQNCTDFIRLRSNCSKLFKYHKNHWWLRKMLQRGFGKIKRKNYNTKRNGVLESWNRLI